MTPELDFLSSFMWQAGNHLWQSTAFAAVAFLLALILKSSHARVRYWVWLAASIKFLVPFALLAKIGNVLGSWIIPAVPVARVPFAVGQIMRPFRFPEQMDQAAVVVPVMDKAITVTPVDGVTYPFTAVFMAIWLIGFTVVIVRWWNRWRRIRAIVRVAAPSREGREADALRRLQTAERFSLPSVELVSSGARLEPGVFGIFKPVLWLPAGIANRLSETELDAILAHELCHARNRDNLAAAFHMLVEAVFWFHPLVWWMGARMVEERERACDEQVVSLCSEPHAYAEGILKVCEFYVASSLTCAAGVTGADLRKRIESIMASRFIAGLGFWKKSLLAVLVTAAVICPILLGIFKAEAQTAGPPSEFGQNARKLEFEVASIKPAVVERFSYSRRSAIRVGTRIYGDRVEYLSVSLRQLIAEAYGIRTFQVATPPNGFPSERFDIACKMPAGSRKEDSSLMLQSLLAERFKLDVHPTSREQDVWALVVDQGGPKFKESSSESSLTDGDTKGGTPEGPDLPVRRTKEGNEVISGTYGITFLRSTLDYSSRSVRHEAHRMTMPYLADLVNRTTFADDHPVVDMTGLKGNYDVVFEFPFAAMGLKDRKAPDSTSQAAGPADSVSDPENGDLLRSLRRLGLDLVKRKASIPYIVVDHVEKTPTEN
ncbi:MAG: M56 family metallopeptidase [Bryobacteraceae bacterium]